MTRAAACSDMLKKSPFFDFLNRRTKTDFQQFVTESVEEIDYIDWNGCLLPDDYGDSEAEYRAIRNECAMFDVSPLRKYRITGSECGAFLDRLLTRPVSKSGTMRGVYVVFCNEDGSLKDDAILHKYSEDDYLLLPSDIDHSAYFEALQARFEIHGVTITDCTDSMVGFALQGPYSATVMSHMGFQGIEHLPPFEIQDFPFADGAVRVSRMGFTADLGYECWIQPDLRPAIEARVRQVRKTLNMEIPGYGLNALQACRLEGGFIVAGWDCATEADPEPGFERSPFELNLARLVNLEAADFVGKEALLEQKGSGCLFALLSFEMEGRCKPADGTALYAREGDREKPVGSINSSAWSETLGKTIGHASIESHYAGQDSAWIDLDGQKVQLKLSSPPLLKLKRARQLPAPIEVSTAA